MFKVFAERSGDDVDVYVINKGAPVGVEARKCNSISESFDILQKEHHWNLKVKGFEGVQALLWNH